MDKGFDEFISGTNSLLRQQQHTINGIRNDRGGQTKELPQLPPMKSVTVESQFRDSRRGTYRKECGYISKNNSKRE